MSKVWETLSGIDVSEHTEKKGNLVYLSWAWAWGIVKKHYPDAIFNKHLYDGPNGPRPYMFDESGYAFTCVTVTIGDQSQTEVLPVLNHANTPVQNPNSFQVNTSLQRCLAKCCAMHGLGHYIYAGEDLPEGTEPTFSIESTDGKLEEVEGLKKVAAVFSTFIPECQNIEDLRSFWSINKQAREALEKGDKKLYQSVLDEFMQHSKTLEEGKAA